MKDSTTLKNILGLTQEEAAVFFGVTPGHWSMISIGKRSLPLEGTIKLGNVLHYLKEEKSISETRQLLDKTETDNLYHKLQQDCISIKMKQYKLAKKISKIENIRTECLAALEVADFLDTQEEKYPIESFAKSIRLRTMKILKKNDLYTLTELQLKNESLEILKLTLERKIQELQK